MIELELEAQLPPVGGPGRPPPAAKPSGRCGYGISHPKSGISHLGYIPRDMHSRECDVPCDMDASKV